MATTYTAREHDTDFKTLVVDHPKDLYPILSEHASDEALSRFIRPFAQAVNIQEIMNNDEHKLLKAYVKTLFICTLKGIYFTAPGPWKLKFADPTPKIKRAEVHEWVRRAISKEYEVKDMFELPDIPLPAIVEKPVQSKKRGSNGDLDAKRPSKKQREYAEISRLGREACRKMPDLPDLED